MLPLPPLNLMPLPNETKREISGLFLNEFILLNKESGLWTDLDANGVPVFAKFLQTSSPRLNWPSAKTLAKTVAMSWKFSSPHDSLPIVPFVTSMLREESYFHMSALLMCPIDFFPPATTFWIKGTCLRLKYHKRAQSFQPIVIWFTVQLPFSRPQNIKARGK